MQQLDSRVALSTGANEDMVDVTGIEPVTPCLQSRSPLPVPLLMDLYSLR